MTVPTAEGIGSAAEVIAERLAEIRDRITAASAPGQKVGVVAVSKRFDPATVAAAVLAGCEDLGENYAQELAAKAKAVPQVLRDTGLPQPLRLGWHMIGPVQRNKVRRISDVVVLWHTLDRAALVEEIARRAPGADVLVQVNLTGEDTKSGATPGEVQALVELARASGLHVQGLMTMGPTDPDVDPRPAFAACRDLADRLSLAHCSMGMSGDFEAAIGEGSTLVRIGTAIFGPRPA